MFIIFSFLLVFLANNGNGFLKTENTVDPFRKLTDSQLLSNLGFGAKTPHEKFPDYNDKDWTPYSGVDSNNQLSDEGLYQDILDSMKSQDSVGHNRIKRKARNGLGSNTNHGPKVRTRLNHYAYPKPIKDKIIEFTTESDHPKKTILAEQMNPGVIFRVRMSDAILRIKQRMYDDPELHIVGDIIYTNLIRKVVSDEINKFHNLLLMYKTDKTIREHIGECGGRIYKFITYMTIKVHVYCLFDALWIDGNPYVIGDEYSVTPVELPPMLQCDAAECNSVVFVDSLTVPKELDE